MRQTMLRRVSRAERFGRKKFRSCNLCENVFSPRTAYERFCSECRHHDELIRFGDWLPEPPETEETEPGKVPA